jgi:hypothetical protein
VNPLRLWLLGTGILLIALAVWALAPLLLFIVLLTAGIGVVSTLMIGIARRIEGWRQRR